jgi:hypothetical protein
LCQRRAGVGQEKNEGQQNGPSRVQH